MVFLVKPADIEFHRVAAGGGGAKPVGNVRGGSCRLLPVSYSEVRVPKSLQA